MQGTIEAHDISKKFGKRSVRLYLELKDTTRAEEDNIVRLTRLKKRAHIFIEPGPALTISIDEARKLRQWFACCLDFMPVEAIEDDDIILAVQVYKFLEFPLPEALTNLISEREIKIL